MVMSLNLNKLKNRPRTVVTSKEALKDIVPFNWSKDVLDGKKKITVGGKIMVKE